MERFTFGLNSEWEPGAQHSLQISTRHANPREACFYPLRYCFPSMNHTHTHTQIKRYLYWWSFDSDYSRCQIYKRPARNGTLRWGLDLAVGASLWESRISVCVQETLERLTRWVFTLALRPGLPQLAQVQIGPTTTSSFPGSCRSVWPRRLFKTAASLRLTRRRGRQSQLSGVYVTLPMERWSV